MKIEMKKRFRALATVASVLLLLGTGTIHAVDCGHCIRDVHRGYVG
ncbi:MAG: hypothetical protein OXG88_05840 [Gammaproteobacteria bacterium]|nr:hypothetical protein [Gammaproteobacteria bacterium]